MHFLTRRIFLGRASLASAGTLLSALDGSTADTPISWRAAIIGHTGQGNYGHDLDLVFQGLSTVKVVAIADPDAAGRTRAAQRSQAKSQYADYREMLAKEKSDLVVIATRWSAEHHAMAMAALHSGAHLLTEKPFTVSLTQADEILALANRTRRKIAVAHQMRLAPNVMHLQHAIADGIMGELVHMRSWGKQDSRSGGEDLIVLGTHIFDMMRLFAGDALWCSARVSCQGHAITRADTRDATERIGPVAGDEIEAQFGFTHGITATFTSRGGLRETLGPWGLELLGTKGAVRILMDIDPRVLRRQRREMMPAGISEEWLPLEDDPTLRFAAAQRGTGPANRRVVEDWLDGIEHDREPQCSGRNAMKAIEMVMAVYAAGLSGKRVTLPLPQRVHPLMS